MSAFEKLPREVRDMIYGYCLIYDGEIIPYPSRDEREEIEKSGRKPAKRCIDYRKAGTTRTTGRDLRSCGGIVYAKDWPSVALLAVNNSMQDEAANVLFGMNVWRLSYAEPWETEEDTLWRRYAGHFRHITVHMSMNDTANLVKDVKKTRAMAKNLGWNVDELRSKIHKDYLDELVSVFDWNFGILMEMNHLKSLVFNVERLFCPHGCCREEVLDSFCSGMGCAGPWYRLEVDKEETKCNTDVKVVGVENESEKEIFMKNWGLEVQ